MGIWAQIKLALNSTILSGAAKPLDIIVKESAHEALYNQLQATTSLENDGVYIVQKGKTSGGGGEIDLPAQSLIITMVFPNGFKELWLGFLGGTTQLKYIIFPQSLRILGDQSLTWCTALRSITLPKGVSSIGSEAFSPNLNHINYEGSVSDWRKITKDSDWKKGMSSICMVHCENGDIPIGDA